jgi:hypothetical protein
MKAPKKRRGIRYRFTTSLFAGVAVALVLLWLSTRHGSGDKIPARALAFGDATAGVFVAAVMFVVWSVLALFRRTGARAAERAREAERAERDRASRGRRRTAGVR